MQNEKIFEMDWAGRKLVVKTGRLAQQSSGSCYVQYGETVVLANVVMGKDDRSDLGFFPLFIDYEEKMYAAGKIKGSRFIKRETRPTDEAVLTGRLIDRGIRPLFPENLTREVQVVLTVLSVDNENDPDIVAQIAASIALSISDIPWNGPIASVRITDNEEKCLDINSVNDKKEVASFDLFLTGDGQTTIMIEVGGKECLEVDLLKAVKLGQENITPVIEFIKKIQKEIGKEKLDIRFELTEKQREFQEKVEVAHNILREEIAKRVDEYLLGTAKKTKALRKNSLEEMKKDVLEILKQKEIEEEVIAKAKSKFKEFVEERVGEALLKDGKRVDRRSIDEIRPLVCDIDLLPRTHGSGLFQRGETQVLSIVTLGFPGEEQMLDSMEESGKKRYMHHYNFPGYSVGEVKPNRGASRRDIGHGSLAEKALLPLIPSKEVFPYTIRVVSEVLSSNGSSSMASTCGSSLSLMSAGVPIKKHVAGIAMGLVSDNKGNYRVFTDLQDLEDAKGGMDFKVAGTKDGITAIQMDTKTSGISFDIIEKTLKMAKTARIQIIQEMEKIIPTAKLELSQYAPKIKIIKISPEKIREVIGPGGKVINDIIDKTGASIEIEQDGTVYVSSVNQEGLDKAIKRINDIVIDPELNVIYDGVVKRVEDFGAFVEILPGKDGLLHISEISHKRTDKVSDALKVGDKIKVQLISIDNMGRINLSIKSMTPAQKGSVSQSPGRENRPEYPRRDDRNNRNNRNDRRPPGFRK